MRAFVFMHHSIDGTKQTDSPIVVMENIRRNMGYIRLFNGSDAEEVAQEIFLRILRNNRGFDDYTPYIKKLARTIRRKKEKEVATDVYSNEGEVSGVFRQLKETVELKTIEGLEGLYKRLRHLYLLNEKSFDKLGVLFRSDLDEACDTNLKKLRTRDLQLYNGLRSIIDTYGALDTFLALEKFLSDLGNLVNVQVAETMKEIKIRPLSKTVSALEKIPDKPTIKDSNGQELGIDKAKLLTEPNPDYIKWTANGTTSPTKRLQCIDITPYMEYLYQEVYVEQGVQTKVITWCGDSYKLTSPSGEMYIDESFEYFINQCRIELLASVIRASIGNIVALSPDSIYFKGKRIENIKLTVPSKVLILPVKLINN